MSPFLQASGTANWFQLEGCQIALIFKVPTAKSGPKVKIQ